MYLFRTYNHQNPEGCYKLFEIRLSFFQYRFLELVVLVILRIVHFWLKVSRQDIADKVFRFLLENELRW